MQTITAHAPGRVELLGNHTDYNEGYVLSAAISYGVTIEGTALPNGRVRLSSTTLNRQLETSLADLQPSQEESWANYVLGVVHFLKETGVSVQGFEAQISGDLPVGAGLSSSAALEVATARFVTKLTGSKFDRLEMAKLCRRAENEFVGVNCGLLDQVSSIFGKKDHAIFLDCRAETVETVAFPKGVELLITHSGVKHALVGGEYNERREQCFEAARILGAKALRDVSSSQLNAARDKMPVLDYKRASHIVGENERVLQGIEFLKRGDASGFGSLMFASHESSRVNFENSTPELDALVAIGRETPGVYGSRLTGGGFGGATVSLIDSSAAAQVRATFERVYKERTGNTCQTYVCEVADGAQ